MVIDIFEVNWCGTKSSDLVYCVNSCVVAVILVSKVDLFFDEWGVRYAVH